MSNDLMERFTFRGKTLDRLSIGALMAVEKILGYDQTIIQGSYNKGVGASAGTHDGGGAIDMVWVDTKRKVRAYRTIGWDYWPRPTLPGSWSAHHHGILHGHPRASSGAKAQMHAYANGRNGLANNGRDPYWRPKGAPITFNYGRSGVVSWQRLNDIARLPGGKPHEVEGARQAESVARVLRGFNMEMRGHRRGRLDEPVMDALRRFRRLRHVGDTEVDGPFGPQVCWELCLPIRESD